MSKALFSFTEMICYLHGVPQWASKVLAMLLLEQTEMGTVVISANWRKEMIKKYRLSESAINQAINLLLKGKLLERLGVNYYKVHALSLPHREWADAKLIVAQMRFREGEAEPTVTVDVMS